MGIKDANDAYNKLMDDYRQPKITNADCKLKFINYKVIDKKNVSKYEKYEQKQINSILGMDDFEDLDMVDVIDSNTKEVLYQFYFFDYGSGSLFKNQTTTEIGVVCQHGFEFMEYFEDEESAFEYFKSLVDLHEAYNSFEGKISQFVEFSLSDFFDDFFDDYGYQFSEMEGVKEYLKSKNMENLTGKFNK